MNHYIIVYIIIIFIYFMNFKSKKLFAESNDLLNIKDFVPFETLREQGHTVHLEDKNESVMWI